ncbi:MAG: hypothetical protein P4L40_14540, partial [Terracidiphilus sp.]|nr:hypothetical protein [Terracidiphilus sp.]
PLHPSSPPLFPLLSAAYLRIAGILPVGHTDTQCHPDVWLQDWATVCRQLGLTTTASLSPPSRLLQTHMQAGELCDVPWQAVAQAFW